jgi:protein tyrosine/serine phosphatase
VDEAFHWQKQRIKESMSLFENAFQIRAHRLDEKSYDQNEGTRLKSIGVHLILAYEDSTAAARRRERSFRSGGLRLNLEEATRLVML